MDANFTKLVGEWLNSPADKRDNAVGALYLLKLSGNQILYRNCMANPDKKSEVIEYHLRKYYNFRIQQLTHEEVEEMAQQVETIVKDHISVAEEAQEFRRGKRDDHDDLPDEIKALWVENLSILQKMRELHLQLRKLSVENTSCPDSERYPFLKELIKFDKQLHSNWDKYDHYIPE